MSIEDPTMVRHFDGNCTVETMMNYSEICLDPDHADFAIKACNHFGSALSHVAVVICVLNGVMGCCGNLLTLIAIPYSIYNNQFGFKRSRDSATILIVNLAFADLMYCSINLPLYTIQYWNGRWPFDRMACRIFAVFRYVNAFGEWMSLAVIALSRCVGLIRNQRCFSWKQGFVIIIAIWFYAFLMILPAVTEHFGKFGYNCMVGKCDFISQVDEAIEPHVFFYAIGFGIPCFVILISYCVIWCYAKNSAKYLRKTSEENRRNVLQREYNMTCTLFLICLCYLVFVAPIAIVNIIDPTAQNPQLHLAFFCVYWFQYSLNFLIYAARCEQYRRAYFFFLGKIIPFWSQKNSNSTVFVLNKEKHVVTSRPRGCDHPSSSKDNIQGPRQILGESVFSSKSTSFVVMGKKRRREIIYEKTEDEVRTTSIHPDSIQEEIILKVHARWRKRSKSCIM
ncbi:protein trapped in endoderm-1-like [Tigriopus californicus]|uniref:protein trapped in endoderm-1-like n=1 Tax=Tigriopus californicus TaxID=6832 RepID=UPI0027DA1B4B|nr:protein trapped in endoderm-1-like [Tigriopus californicus]